MSWNYHIVLGSICNIIVIFQLAVIVVTIIVWPDRPDTFGIPKEIHLGTNLWNVIMYSWLAHSFFKDAA